MFSIVTSLLFTLLIGMCLTIVLGIINLIFFKKTWLDIVSRLCFYIPMLLIAIFGMFHSYAMYKCPMIFERFASNVEYYFFCLGYIFGFVFILYMIAELFLPKKEKDKKDSGKLELEIKKNT